MISYIPEVWDLVKKKKFDRAWRVANKALIELAQIISTDRWKNYPSLNSWGIEWAREEIGLQVYSMYYAMAEISWREKRYEDAVLYSKVALAFNMSDSPIKVLEKARGKLDDYNDNSRFGKIIKPWVDLKLVKRKRLSELKEILN